MQRATLCKNKNTSMCASLWLLSVKHFSAFPQVLSDAGGSLMLAVLNGDILFPEPDAQPQELRSLIRLCLTTDPGSRPFVGDVISRVQDLLVRCPSESS